MWGDHARKAAYDAPLRRAMPFGSRGLDIGAGTGLLAMMAARAGAIQVAGTNIAMTRGNAETVAKVAAAVQAASMGRAATWAARPRASRA